MPRRERHSVSCNRSAARRTFAESCVRMDVVRVDIERRSDLPASLESQSLPPGRLPIAAAEGDRVEEYFIAQVGAKCCRAQTQRLAIPFESDFGVMRRLRLEQCHAREGRIEIVVDVRQPIS